MSLDYACQGGLKMICSDPLVRAFKRYGYNVVRLPSAQFAPLLLLESGGRSSVQAIGPLDANLPAPSTPPAVHHDDPAPDLDIRTTNQVSGQIAASFLAPVLAAFGAGAGVAASLSSARSVAITLRDVRRDWVELGEVADYLESGTGPGSRHVREAARRGALFVVTAALKSASFSLGVDRSVAEQVSASVTAASPLTVSVKEQAERGAVTVLSFKGRSPLSFAFQAVKLLYEDGQYIDFMTARGLSGFALSATAAGMTEGMLAVEEDLVETGGA
jgi:hypothetical protein